MTWVPQDGDSLDPLHPKPQAPPHPGAELMAPHGQMFTHLIYLSLPLAPGRWPHAPTLQWALGTEKQPTHP